LRLKAPLMDTQTERPPSPLGRHDRELLKRRKGAGRGEGGLKVRETGVPQHEVSKDGAMQQI
jgi:hypothetical protein